MIIEKGILGLISFVIIHQSILITALPTEDRNSGLGPSYTLGTLDGKIINGTLANLNDTRYQVSLRKKLNDGYYFGAGHICGGSLIRDNIVLTAAHCIVNYDSPLDNTTYLPADSFIVVMGSLDRFERNNNTLIFDVQTLIPGTPRFNLSTYDKDLALLVLNASVPANWSTVRPIELYKTEVAAGTVCQVTGWGTTENDTLAEYLMTVDVPIISTEVCKNDTLLPEESILEGMFCAGYMQGERDACQGDSGGPLACSGKQFGIVSWGYGCAQPELPGVYTDVSYYYDWIEEQIKPYTTDGAVNIRSCSLTVFLSFLVVVLCKSVKIN